MHYPRQLRLSVQIWFGIQMAAQHEQRVHLQPIQTRSSWGQRTMEGKVPREQAVELYLSTLHSLVQLRDPTMDTIGL